MQRGSAASGPTPCGDAAKGDILFLRKRISPLHPQEKGRGESPLDSQHCQFAARITARAAQCGCGVHGFAMNPCELLLRSTAPYYREARVTVARRQTACRMRHCCARRIVECPDRRELLRTSTRWAERHPQGVCRIRKASEPPTAAQQRMIGAEANRIAASNAATPRYGQCNRQALQLFELLACNGKRLSFGRPHRPFSFHGKKMGVASRGTCAASPFAPVRKSIRALTGAKSEEHFHDFQKIRPAGMAARLFGQLRQAV